MAIDKVRVGKLAMEFMDYLEEGYPDGEIEGVVVCAVVRVSPGGERRVRFIGEPNDRELIEGTVYSVLETIQGRGSRAPAREKFVLASHR